MKSESCILYCYTWSDLGPSVYSGYWAGAHDKYAGLIISDGNDTIMGWVKMDVFSPDHIVIKEYAWMVYSHRTHAYFNYYKTGYQVKFNNYSIGANSFEWDFDDGQVSEDPEPVHTFSQAGDYNVCLTAFGTYVENTACESINICEIPTAGFSFEVSKWGNLTLHNLSVMAESYHWDFGNGDTSVVKTPEYTYTEDGNYTITLTVYRGTCSDTLSLNASVCVYPKADLYYEQNDTTVSFFNTSLKTDSLVWLFGDGFGSFNENPVHSFHSGGEYQVMLYVYNSCGQDSLTETILLSQEDIPTAAGITLYPVPAGDRLMIEPAFLVHRIKAFIYDPSGHLIVSFTDENTSNGISELDLSTVNEGLYVLKLFLDDQIFIRKIIIMR